MSLHIIIDGYNLIRQSKSFRHLDNQSIQWGRDALIDTLSAYKRLKSHNITVIFDGIQAPYLAPTGDRIKGIRIQFSRNGESADRVIKRLARTEKEKALVVSSDRDVVQSCEAYGAATISAESFEIKIAMAAQIQGIAIESDEQTGWKPTTKKKGPSRRLSKKKRRNKMKIRKL
jgi:predicted RNA-binding protein with PIN domain